MCVQEEEERRRGAEEMATEARLRQVQSERDALAVRLRETARSLREQEEGWRREKSKALALMFSTPCGSVDNTDRRSPSCSVYTPRVGA